MIFMKDQAKAVLIFFFIVSFFSALGFYFYKKETNIPDPMFTCGTIRAFTMVGAKGIQKCIYSYEVKGQEYRTTGYFNTTLVLGDKFQIVYSVSNPSKSKVVSFKPLFVESEPIKSSRAVIKDKSGIEGNWVAFEYEIGGIVYFRVQDLDPKTNLKELSVGDRFNITYLATNPQRSIISIQ